MKKGPVVWTGPFMMRGKLSRGASHRPCPLVAAALDKHAGLDVPSGVHDCSNCSSNSVAVNGSMRKDRACDSSQCRASILERIAFAYQTREQGNSFPPGWIRRRIHHRGHRGHRGGGMVRKRRDANFGSKRSMRNSETQSALCALCALCGETRTSLDIEWRCLRFVTCTPRLTTRRLMQVT